MSQRDVLLLAALTLAGCSAEKAQTRGQLMLVLSTDMSVPKDVSALSAKVSLGAAVQYQQDFSLAPSGLVYLPGTLAIVTGDESAEVALEVTGFQQRADGSRVARTFAKVTTTVPTARMAMLRMPAQWLCDGSALEIATDDFVSTCSAKPGEPEASCVAGACQPVTVSEASLPNYEPAQVYGGGAGPDDPLAQCFDVSKCFANATHVIPDSACQLPLIDDGRPINVGLRTEAGGDGICDSEQPSADCLVVLDQDATFGWFRSADGSLQLPPAVCERIASGVVSGVSVSRACSTKTAQFPACGQWSSVGR